MKSTKGEVVRLVPLHCHKCGCFVGKKGHEDIWSTDYGGYEEGYSTCSRHTDQNKPRFYRGKWYQPEEENE